MQERALHGNQPERGQVQFLENYKEGPCDTEVSTAKEITGEKCLKPTKKQNRRNV